MVSTRLKNSKISLSTSVTNPSSNNASKMSQFTRILSQTALTSKRCFSLNHHRSNLIYSIRNISTDKPLSSDPYSPERLKQTSEYFSQYIEEYYEEEEEDAIEEPFPEKPLQSLEILPKSSISEITGSEVVALLEEHRALDIVSITPPAERSAHNEVIICSPYNNRHAEALAQTIRKHIKTLYHFDDSQLPRHNKVTNGWFVYDMRSVVLHVLSAEARARYDLESLYSPDTTNESKNNEDESDLLPPSASPTS